MEEDNPLPLSCLSSHSTLSLQENIDVTTMM